MEAITRKNKTTEDLRMGEIKSDQEGKWFYIEPKPLKVGTYEVFAETINSLGAKSEPSEKITIHVGYPVLIKIGKLTLDYLSLIYIITVIVLLGLTLVIVLGTIKVFKKIKQKRIKARKKISESKKAFSRAFEVLKKEIEKQVVEIDGEPGLSEREKKVCNELKKALKISEKFISKKIKNIEKELK
jgi:hypothetical protein